MLIKSVIFQSTKWYWIVALKDYKRYIYENFITPQRLVLVDTTPDFWDDIQDITGERLREVLDEELWANPLTAYMN